MGFFHRNIEIKSAEKVLVRAGSSKMKNTPLSDPQTMNTLDYSTLNVCTWLHEQGEPIDEEFLL